MNRSIFFALCLVLAVTASKVIAQPGSQQQQSNTTQVNWQDELKYAQEENRALRNIMAAIQSIDTARQNELIQYIVTDRSVRNRVISALRKGGYNLTPNTEADLMVTQKPGSRDALTGNSQNTYQDEVQLLRIVIDNVGIYGTPTIKRILGEDLYNKINNRNDIEYTMVSTPNVQTRIQYALINASLFGGDIIFKSGFGFGMTVGNDYVGLPFWQAGNVGIQGIIHKENTDVRLGLNFQLGEAGITPFSINGGLRIKERKLEGTQGFNALIIQNLNLIDKRTGVISVGGEFFQAFTPSITTLSLRASTDSNYRTTYVSGTWLGRKKDSLFYLDLSTHIWGTYEFVGVLNGAYISLGAGTHRINAVTIGAKNVLPGQPGSMDVVIAKSFDQFDPLAKIGYRHGGSDGYDWGLSLQYCNQLMADGFLQIFSWLDLEAKYASVVGRDPKKWEWSDFFMISPVLHLNF